FARPAVVVSFLDQWRLIPPVGAARALTRALVRVLSTRARKVMASECLVWLKALSCSVAALSLFVGDFDELLRGEVEDEKASPSPSTMDSRLRCVNLGGFFGECWSFQSLMTSWLQNASMPGR
ncbi:MAG: hypothetical protein Q9164_007736, partial [Protoblastenia rupestris]